MLESHQLKILFQEKDGKLIVIRTTASLRILLVATALNSIVSKGYAYDQIDWYRINKLLALYGDSKYAGTIITTLKEFQELYRQVDIKKEKGFTYSNIDSKELVSVTIKAILKAPIQLAA